MRNLVFSITLAAAMAVSIEAAAKTAVAVFLDTSPSVGFVSDPEFAKRAGAFLAKEIAKIDDLSGVEVIFFSDYDQALTERVGFSADRKNTPERIGEDVGDLVSSVPHLVEQGRIEVGESTHLLSTLEGESWALDCESDPAILFVLSDALEASTDASPKAVMSGKRWLPKPDGEILRACTVVFVGIGAVNNGTPALTRALIKHWQAWIGEAGARMVPRPRF